MDTDTLKDLFRHMEWADSLLWSAVLASPDAQANEKLHELLFHIHNVQHAFLTTWRAQSPVRPDQKEMSLDEIMSWGRTFYPEANAFLESLTADDIARPMPVAWSKFVEARTGRPAATTTIGETLTQVVLHGMNHRGQANTRIRELGGTPSLVDYIAWVWFGRPNPEWPIAN